MHLSGRKSMLFFGCLVLATSHLFSASDEEEPPGKVVEEVWQKVSIQGSHTGYGHTVTYEVIEDGETRFLSVSRGILDLSRLGQSTTIESSGRALETAEGETIWVESEVIMSKSPTLYRGVVEGETMVITSEASGQKSENRIEWQRGVMTERQGGFMMAEMAKEPEGTERTFLSFNPQVTQILGSTYKTGPKEKITWQGKEVPTTQIIGFADIAPNAVTRVWVDAEGRILRTESPLIGGVDIVAEMSTKEEALADRSGEPQPDIMRSAMLKTNVLIPKSRFVDEVLYKVTLKEGARELPEFLESHYQQIESRSDREVTIRVRRVVPNSRSFKVPLREVPDSVKSSLESNLTIQSDDPDIIAVATKTVGDEEDAWQAAVILERFVFDYIETKGFETAFASASEVLKDKAGDCSEHAVLHAAFCRSIGIPARVAMGLEYIVETFAPHAWTEVWLGEWYPLDATNGAGFVDAAHLTFSADALADDGNPAFLQMGQALGYLDVQVLELRYGDRVIDCRTKPIFHEIDGDGYRNELIGISFQKPASWNYDGSFGVGNVAEICEIEGDDEGEKIEVRVTAVGFGMKLDDVGEALGAQGLAASEWVVDGRRAIRFLRPESRGMKKHEVMVYEGDTLFIFKLQCPEEDPSSEDLFDAFLETVDFDLK